LAIVLEASYKGIFLASSAYVLCVPILMFIVIKCLLIAPVISGAPIKPSPYENRRVEYKGYSEIG
jgi:hypothetical protein